MLRTYLEVGHISKVSSKLDTEYDPSVHYHIYCCISLLFSLSLGDWESCQHLEFPPLLTLINLCDDSPPLLEAPKLHYNY